MIMENFERADYYEMKAEVEAMIRGNKIAHVVESVMFVMATVVLWVVTLAVREFSGLVIETICLLLSATATILAFNQVAHTLEVFHDKRLRV